jgi:hypothetical protein
MEEVEYFLDVLPRVVATPRPPTTREFPVALRSMP